MNPKTKIYFNRTFSYLFPVLVHPWVEIEDEPSIRKLQIRGLYLWDNEFPEQSLAGEPLLFMHFDPAGSSAGRLPGFRMAYTRSDGRHIAVYDLPTRFHDTYVNFLRSRYSLMMDRETVSRVYRYEIIRHSIPNMKMLALHLISSADVIRACRERRSFYLADVEKTYGVRIGDDEFVELDSEIQFCDREILFSPEFPDTCGCLLQRPYRNKECAMAWYEKAKMVMQRRAGSKD